MRFFQDLFLQNRIFKLYIFGMYLFEGYFRDCRFVVCRGDGSNFARASLKTVFSEALSPVRIFPKVCGKPVRSRTVFLKERLFPEVRFKKMTLRKVDFCGADFFPHPLKGHGPLRLQNRKDHLSDTFRELKGQHQSPSSGGLVRLLGVK